MNNILRYFAQRKFLLMLYLSSAITALAIAQIAMLGWVTTFLLTTSLSLVAHAVYNVMRAVMNTVNRLRPPQEPIEPEPIEPREPIQPREFIRLMNLNLQRLQENQVRLRRVHLAHGFMNQDRLNPNPQQNPNRLGRTVAYNESAMRDLEPGEQKALNEVTTRYERRLAEVGQAQVFNQIRDYLREEYEKNPVKLPNQNDFAYPLDYMEELEYPNHVKELYYRNVWHTAYRYLFWEPNHFMADNAQYVSDCAGGRRSDIDPEDKKRIAYMWLMAMDETLALPDTFTSREQIKEQVAFHLAQCGRGHNWDNSRFNNRGEDEYYDDMLGDKPTCSRGVKRNVVQCYSLFFRVLDVDVLRNKFKELVVAQGHPRALYTKLRALSNEDRQLFFEGIDELSINLFDWEDFKKENLQAHDLLKNNLPDEEFIHDCIRECREYFTPRYFDARDTNIIYQAQQFASYEALIRHWQEKFYECFALDLRNLRNEFSTENQNEAPSDTYLPNYEGREVVVVDRNPQTSARGASEDLSPRPNQ